MSTPTAVVVAEESGPELRVTEVEVADPVGHEVLVRQAASGICHSQLHEVRAPRRHDLLLGHEAIGTVAAVGPSVSGLSPGDRVLTTWVPRATGEGGREPVAASLPLPTGRVARSANVYTWSEVSKVDEQYVVPIGPGPLTDSLAVVACAVMTGAGAVLRSAGVTPGASVAVIGAGGVGLSAVVGARVAGAGAIIAVDRVGAKLELARSFGATHTIDAGQVDVVNAIRDLTRSDEQVDYWGRPVVGADFVFDCIGVDSTLRQLLPATRSACPGLRRGGTAVVVGMPTTRLDVNAFDLMISEKSLIGTLGGSSLPGEDLPEYVRWSEDGTLDLDRLVTDRYGLDQIARACEDLAAGRVAGRALLTFPAPSLP